MAAESMEERKARLQALRLAADLSALPDEENRGEQSGSASSTAAASASADAQEPGADEEDAEEEPEPVVRFRNYVPRDEKLQELKVAPPEVLKFEDPIARDTVDANGTEDPIVNIAPKKANWDIRRDVAKKLEKLEKRTQRAIIQLMQEEEKRRQEASAQVDDMD